MSVETCREEDETTGWQDFSLVEQALPTGKVKAIVYYGGYM